MNQKQLSKLFLRAARSALVFWKGEYSTDDEELAHDLWVWYLERPSVQEKLETADAALAQTLVRDHALKILSGKSAAADVENAYYSSESVKDALLGVSTNRYLLDILPMAMETLNEQYAEALRSRYDDGISPQDKSGQNALFRAHRAVTEIVNRIAHTAGLERDEDGNLLDKEGPGSAAAVYPETRKEKGDHSDPTANTFFLLQSEQANKPEVLCATHRVDHKVFGKILQPIRGANGRALDSDQTTTHRKEFMA
ncbi:sigma-K factor [Mycobacterium phage 20ES]|uniref:sigma-K factor n=1 Tax=Mycobacterium phage First TaxID=1245814 RepID=UPI0002C05152|nr:sigma-K factor [Mycobacterium phage First]YP_009009103.1 sigma-K factor [Mycobacterium phage 20ES]AFV51184.1 hypothetical protein First_0056 [Mycobacterium phage First]AHJ86510.1 hypothetical protein 20ES_57 [Mycobacterium phage 20ES]